MTRGQTAAEDLRLDVMLAEYDNICAELYERWDTQRQSIAFVVAVLGATLGLAASEGFDLTADLVVWLPILVAPFAFLFFDNELMIWGIIRYIVHELWPKITEIVGEDRVPVGLDSRRFDPSMRAVQPTHFVMSVSRWILFFVPIFGAPAFVVASGFQFLSSPLTVAAIVIDLILGVLLLAGAFVAVRLRRSVWKLRVSR